MQTVCLTRSREAAKGNAIGVRCSVYEHEYEHEHEHEESPGVLYVARAFQPEHCAAPHSTGVLDCPNAVYPGRLAPSPPTPLPRFTGARGGLRVFLCPEKRNSTPRPWKGRGDGGEGYSLPFHVPAAAFSTQLISREDAKTRSREGNRKGRREGLGKPAASMPHTRALPCPARLKARLKARLNAPPRSSGFPARAQLCTAQHWRA